MTDHTFITLQPEHVHEWVSTSTGGMHFSNGEVWDDTRDYLVCACGAEIDQLPADVLEETEIPF